MTKPRWSFLAHARTSELRSSSKASEASQVLSNTTWLMFDFSVISHGFLVYQVIMLAVDFRETSLLKIGTSFCVFSNRMALKMCVTILFMLRRINNLFLRSSWYS